MNITCTSHRPRMISSELIYAGKYDFGEPVAHKVIFKCFCCNLITECTFKEKKN